MSNQEEIDKNRDEIERLLSAEIPLDLKYMRIRMLAAKNEQLINKAKENNMWQCDNYQSYLCDCNGECKNT